MEKLDPNPETLKNDVPDGMNEIVTKMDSFLKQLLIWIRILVVGIICISLVAILVNMDKLEEIFYDPKETGSYGVVEKL